MSDSTQKIQPPPWPLIALAAWILPGLGHAVAGQPRRGFIVGGALLLLFATGMLLGGIDVIDRRRDTLWFAGQAFIGPVAFTADFAHRVLDRRRDEQIDAFRNQPGAPYAEHDIINAMNDQDIPLVYRTSIGKPNEYGTLYCTLAGIMNLLVILDAAGRKDRSPE